MELCGPTYGDKGALWARPVRAEEQRRRDLEVAKAMEARRRLAAEEAPMLEARELLGLAMRSAIGIA